MAAYQTQQINVGSIAAPEVGKVFTDFADRLQKQQASQIDMARQMRQDDRQQLLNQRADQEWNREIGLREARKNIAAEFTASPYAAKFGSGKETAMLDKQVLDYVNNGGEINEDLAKRLQARYEEALPFREDAANAIASSMIALGEDPTKAKQEADVLASGQLKSRAEKQSALDANQQMAQKYYDEWAKANLEAAKMNLDIGKANLNADTDIMKLKLQAGMGGTGSGGSTGGFGGNWYDAQETIEKMKFGGIDTYFDAKPFLKTAKSMGYSPNQAVWALKQGADIGLVDKTFDEETSKAFLQKMTPMQTGIGGTKLDMAVSGTQFMPQFAPKQIAGYDPKGFLEGSRSTLPELFRGNLDSTNTTKGTNTADKRYSSEKMPEGLSYEDKVTWFENRDAVAKGGIDAAYKVEGGKDKGWGRYQMMGSTLDGYRKNFGNFTNEQFKNDPALQDKVFAQYSADNEKTLVKQGVPVNDWTKWLAHNLGSGNVKDFLNRNETSDLKNAMQRQSGSPKTIDDYIDNFGRGFTADDLTSVVPRDNRYLPTDDTMQSPANPQIAELLNKVKNINEYTAQDKPLDIPSKVIQAAKEDYLASGGGLLDDSRIKSNLARDGKLSEQDAEKVYEQVKDNVASDNNIAYRNYLIAKRTGSYQGKSADDWYDELDSKSKGAVWAPAAPIIAALPPAAMLFGGGAVSTLPTITSAGARTVSGGSRANILNDMFVPQIQRLMSQPYTAEVKEGLLKAVSKLPQAEKIQVIKYIQRMEQLGK